MTENEGKFDPHLLQLILSLQAGAMQHLGKVVSPVSGKIERNLELAHHTIEILGMLEDKTRGNLTEEEAKLLSRALYELRMNFVDESKKSEGKASDEAGPEPAPNSDSSQAEESDEKENKD